MGIYEVEEIVMGELGGYTFWVLFIFALTFFALWQVEKEKNKKLNTKIEEQEFLNKYNKWKK
jgi:hypothetical protein